MSNTIANIPLNEIKDLSSDISSGHTMDNVEQMYREKRGKIGKVVQVRRDIHSSGAKSAPEEFPISELYNLSQSPKDSHFHECLCGPSSTYVDFEQYEYTGGPTYDRKKLIDNLITQFKDMFHCMENEFLMFDSSGDVKDIKNGRQTTYKHSFRIIHHDCYWYSPSDQLPKITLLNERIGSIDLTCYKQNQTMRIPYSTKMGQARVLQKIDLTDSALYPLIPIEKITKDEFEKFIIQTTIPISNDSRYPGAPPREDDKHGQENYNQIETDDFVKEVLKQACLITKANLSIQAIKPWSKYGLIELRHYNEMCPLCEDIHDGNRNYIIFNPKAKTAALKCHGTKGKGKRIMLKESPLINMTLLGGNEYKLAELFANAHAQDIKIMDDGCSYIWNENKKLWLKGKDIHVQNMISPYLMSLIDTVITDQTDPKAIAALRKIHCQAGRTSTAKALMSPLKTMLYGTPEWEDKLNMAPRLFPTANGTIVELDKGISRPRTRHDMFTFERPVRLIPEAERDFSDIKRFFMDVFLGDANIQLYMRKMLGLCLTGETARKFFIWIGERASNGKSSLIKIMESILGARQFFTSLSKYVFVKAKGMRSSPNEHQSHLVPLMGGIRMAVANESDEGDELNGSQIKDIADQGTIMTARPIYKPEVQFENHACIIMTTNHTIAFQAHDQGVTDRFSPVTFNCRFVHEPDASKQEKKIDNEFIKRIQTDTESLSQTFTYLVIGAMLFFKDGLESPESIQKAKQEIIKDQDHFTRFFEEQYIVDHKNADAGVRPADIQARYNTWRIPNGAPELNVPQIVVKLKPYKGETKTSSKGVIYLGIKPKPTEEDNLAQRQLDMIHAH